MLPAAIPDGVFILTLNNLSLYVTAEAGSDETTPTATLSTGTWLGIVQIRGLETLVSCTVVCIYTFYYRSEI